MILPPIVIVACNRHKSLSRLLNSIARADIPRGVELIISIDKSPNGNVTRVANKFEWNVGEKKVIKQRKNLGIKEHMFSCFKRTKKHKAIVLLEEDCLVAPGFYLFALKTMHFYDDEPKVAGISLYNFLFNENNSLPFYPMDDGNDVYFMQQASSRGLLVTEQGWNQFQAWLESPDAVDAEKLLPREMKNWGGHSWKKVFNQYLIAQDKYFVFPRIGYATNFGDKGVHVTGERNEYLFQSPLPVKSKNDLDLPIFKTSLSVYDAWFEPVPAVLKKLNKKLQDYDFTTDLYGYKEAEDVKTDWVLTLRETDNAEHTFDAALKPLPLNVAYNLKGRGISLAKKENVQFKNSFEWEYAQYVFYFPFVSLKSQLRYKLHQVINKFRKKGKTNK